jgi:hypothetical protein
VDEDLASRVGHGFCNCCSALNDIAESRCRRKMAAFSSSILFVVVVFAQQLAMSKAQQCRINPDATSFVLILSLSLPSPSAPLSISPSQPRHLLSPDSNRRTHVLDVTDLARHFGGCGGVVEEKVVRWELSSLLRIIWVCARNT